MPRICSQRGCNIQLSRVRIENGLTRCARHGRQLRRGNPVARRVRNRRVCKRPSCGLRLSGPRLSAGCSYCALHGGPWPTGPFGLGPRLRANSVEQLECSADFLAPRARDGCVGSRVLLQLLRQYQGYPGTAGVMLPTLEEPTRCPAMRHIRANAPPELLLLNAALARRLSPEAAATLGWQTTWSPGGVLQTLVHFHGSLLSENHHISIRNQASALVDQKAPLRALLQRVVVGPVGALWNTRANLLLLARKHSWQWLLESLEQVPGFGPFFGSILAWDLRALSVATRLPRDRFTFVSWGSTGATKGLNALLNRPRSAVLEPGCCRAWGRCILRFLLKVCPRNVLGRRVRLELYSVAWLCCEVSKTDSSVWAPGGR